jgi:hypothetical protein
LQNLPYPIDSIRQMGGHDDLFELFKCKHFTSSSV